MEKIFYAKPSHIPVLRDILGWFIRPVIIADFGLMKEAFGKKELCSRLGNPSVRQLEASARKVCPLYLIHITTFFEEILEGGSDSRGYYW